jgi:hypothetical protein
LHPVGQIQGIAASDQRVVDARVFDASGREKKFHDASPGRYA